MTEFSGLTNAIASTRTAGNRLSGSLTRFIGNTDNLSPEQSRFRGGLSLSLARLNEGSQSGNSFASTLSGSLRQAKARLGIANRGEAAIRNQQLKDRLEIARLGVSKRARGLSSLANAASIREGVNLANQDADASIASSNADLFGGALGIGAALIKNRKRKDEDGE